MIDTNILVSSILITASIPDQALKKARIFGDILLSASTFEEIQTILNKPKFDKYVSVNIRSQFLAKIKLESEQVTIVENINICRDHKDNKFLDVAINGNADYLITGDQDLLVLNPFRGVEIITPAEFLNIIL